MARVEKTVFISYRRTDLYNALAVYQYLQSQNFDVFFDVSSLSSGDFEQVIISNIRARAHFLVILTPTALDRCYEPGDWLRREIETAVDERRNIIPLFFDSFSFGAPNVAEKLTGKLAAITRYNGLEVPNGYFLEAMHRLSTRYLNIPLNAVIHPISNDLKVLVKNEQVAADQALKEYWDEIKALIQPDRKRLYPNLRFLGISISILLMTALGISIARNGINGIISPSALTNIYDSTLTTDLVTKISLKDGMPMIYVPAGIFTMGSETGDKDEIPVHAVYLNAFWIDQTEVTNALYSACVKADECTAPANQYYYSRLSYANHPVVFVSWSNAVQYCSWVGRRLPTEAEWEKAARGENGFLYPWGSEPPNDDLLNYNMAVRGTTEVGKYPNGASPYDALDMAGNVWEWVEDWYDESFYDDLPDFSPSGPVSGQFRVIRGGSWSSDYNNVRPANRAEMDPTNEADTGIGFRCAMSAIE